MPDPNVSPAAAPVRRKILVRAGGLPVGFIDPRFDAVLDEDRAVDQEEAEAPAACLASPCRGATAATSAEAAATCASCTASRRRYSRRVPSKASRPAWSSAASANASAVVHISGTVAFAGSNS